MQREVDMSEISDGRRYKSTDMVKCGTNDCRDCFECCRFVGDTIILDPMDIYMLNLGTGKSFAELLQEEKIELNMKEGLLLPNIKTGSEDTACGFLKEDGRCGIHNYRPGFCRLFPLGRVYEDGGFSYFLQVHECPRAGKSKVKVKKWIGIPNLEEYEKFVLIWHDHLRDFSEELRNGAPDKIAGLTVMFLKHYFEKPYDMDRPFYEQFYERYDLLNG